MRYSLANSSSVPCSAQSGLTCHSTTMRFLWNCVPYTMKTRRSFEIRFSSETFGPGSDVVSSRPGSYVNESANGSTREPRRRLADWMSSDWLALLKSALAGDELCRVSAPAPRSETSVVSRAGGWLETVGGMRWRVPVMFSDTSTGPDSTSLMPPLTRASSEMSKYGSMRNGFWKLIEPRTTW